MGQFSTEVVVTDDKPSKTLEEEELETKVDIVVCLVFHNGDNDGDNDGDEEERVTAPFSSTFSSSLALC